MVVQAHKSEGLDHASSVCLSGSAEDESPTGSTLCWVTTACYSCVPHPPSSAWNWLLAGLEQLVRAISCALGLRQHPVQDHHVPAMDRNQINHFREMQPSCFEFWLSLWKPDIISGTFYQQHEYIHHKIISLFDLYAKPFACLSFHSHTTVRNIFNKAKRSSINRGLCYFLLFSYENCSNK